jgi:hypothetical protein
MRYLNVLSDLSSAGIFIMSWHGLESHPVPFDVHQLTRFLL